MTAYKDLTEEQKQRKREAHRKWAARNKTARQKYMKEWHAEQPGYYRKWRRKNPDKVLQSRQKYREQHSDKLYERTKRYVDNNREKARAHWRVKKAIKSGRLTRLPCEVCSNPRSQAHHDDYSKPLDVRWLCAACHSAHHHRLEAA